MTTKRLNREETRGTVVNETIRKLQELDDAITTVGRSVMNAATIAAAQSALGVASYAASSWTPVLTFGGTSVGVVYTTQVGRYVRLGDMVMVWATIVITANGSSTGNATLTGLPFAASTVTGLVFAGQMIEVANITGSIGHYAAIDSAASVIRLHDEVGTQHTDVTITDTASFSVCISYRTG